MKSFLEKPPYDRPVLTLTSNIELARLGRLLARKRDYEAQIRAIDTRIKALLLGGARFQRAQRGIPAAQSSSLASGKDAGCPTRKMRALP